MRKKNFKIDRSIWRCGGPHFYPGATGFHGAGGTLMLNDEGFKCCLGQIASQCGFTDEQLLDRSEPCDTVYYARVNNPKVKSTGFLTKIDVDISEEDASELSTGDILNTNLAADAISINDDEQLSFKEREIRLAKLFKKAGYNITFTGKYQNE